MQYGIKRFAAVCTTVLLTTATMIGIPLKAYVQHIKHDPKCVDFPPLVWTTHMAKIYTRGLIAIDYPTWNRSEWQALNKLWTVESHWNAKAFNHTKEMYSGKYAGGIPQLLGMKTNTPAPQQVARGLSYIQARYGKPSVAWAFHRKHGYY